MSWIAREGETRKTCTRGRRATTRVARGVSLSLSLTHSLSHTHTHPLSHTHTLTLWRAQGACLLRNERPCGICGGRQITPAIRIKPTRSSPPSFGLTHYSQPGILLAVAAFPPRAIALFAFSDARVIRMCRRRPTPPTWRPPGCGGISRSVSVSLRFLTRE